MQSQFEPETLRGESRFHPDTVKKAVALAQQLEQKRRETLSLEQVRQLAEELNLDPQLLQQALAQVSAEEARRLVPQTSPQQAAGLRSRNQTAIILLVIALALVLPLLLLVGYASVSVAPPAPATAVIQELPAPVPSPESVPTPPPSNPPPRR